jgi:hypothetical protein
MLSCLHHCSIFDHRCADLRSRGPERGKPNHAPGSGDPLRSFQKGPRGNRDVHPLDPPRLWGGRVRFWWPSPGSPGPPEAHDAQHVELDRFPKQTNKRIRRHSLSLIGVGGSGSLLPYHPSDPSPHFGHPHRLMSSVRLTVGNVFQAGRGLKTGCPSQLSFIVVLFWSLPHPSEGTHRNEARMKYVEANAHGESGGQHRPAKGSDHATSSPPHTSRTGSLSTSLGNLT